MSQPHHATSSTHDNAEEEASRLTLFATWQVKDQNTAWYFGVAMVGLAVVFTLAHWLQVFYNKRFSKSSTLDYHVRGVARPLRVLNKATIPGGTMFQPGITMLVLVYLGINAALVFHDHPEKVALTILAKRFGW